MAGSAAGTGQLKKHDRPDDFRHASPGHRSLGFLGQFRDDQSVEVTGVDPMRSLSTLAFTTILSLSFLHLLPGSAAHASGRLQVGGYDPETGNAAVISGGYHSQTGARYGRAAGYDAATGTYAGTTRFYNPSTGEGFTTSTEARHGSGVTSTLHTVNQGSYSCTVSQSVPAHCAEISY
ncbi:MAG: hypothetical protein HC921_11710 [Synechococcaceae cyanobacterium SM2_3_1]|nr:hypothetical protein [Synechococcaceae cyanobacterium SM2_3_1]